MSPALRPVMAALKVRFNCVVVCVDDPLEVTLFNITEIPPPPVTITVQVAVFLPSSVVTVIVAVPDETAVTTPPITVATAGLLEVHVTVLLVALPGATVAVRVSVFPGDILVLGLFNDTPVTGTVTKSPAVTVTVQVAVLLPSAVVTVIVAVPAALAVTVPLVSTAATAGLLEVHVRLWLVALLGATVAIRVSEPPAVRKRLVYLSVMFDTGTVSALPPVTVTVQAAILASAVVLTVIVAVPFETAVTKPPFTVATVGSLETHVTF